MTSSNHDASLRYKDFILSIKCARARERDRKREIKGEEKGGEKERRSRAPVKLLVTFVIRNIASYRVRVVARANENRVISLKFMHHIPKNHRAFPSFRFRQAKILGCKTCETNEISKFQDIAKQEFESLKSIKPSSRQTRYP